MKKRKFYLALPLLVLPFVTLAFWALGGGSQASADGKPDAGLNLQLPDAKLKDEKNFDKLSFYEEADKDSIHNTTVPDTGMKVLVPLDANEQNVYSKINELKQQINVPTENKFQNNPLPQNNTVNEQFTQQVDKLQGMMQHMNDKPEKDTEIEQLGNVLDKIMDIQHPDRVKETKEKSVATTPQVFAVNLRDTIKEHNGFFDDNIVSNDTVTHAIEGVVHETQTIISGAAVKLRLTNDIYVNGILIPRGNFIYGTASLENERLSIAINSIRYNNNLLPVALQVYDMDGLAGIHVPGSISRDVAKQSTEQSLQNIDLATLDPSLVAQAANTGIQAAKNLLSKKVKLIKVTLKAGYKVLLNNKNN